MPAYEIPLAPNPRRLTIALGSRTIRLRFYFANTDEGGWAMDIADAAGRPILCGVALVTGTDLLAQYAYLGFGGALYVRSDVDPGAVPTFTNLGVGSHLYWVPSP